MYITYVFMNIIKIISLVCRYTIYITQKLILILSTQTTLVAWWSELLLTTNHEVLGSIPGSTMCVFP